MNTDKNTASTIASALLGVGGLLLVLGVVALQLEAPTIVIATVMLTAAGLCFASLVHSRRARLAEARAEA